MIATLIIIAAPLLHSLEQVLMHKPVQLRWMWLNFSSKRFSALDGEHTYRLMFVLAYIAYGAVVLPHVAPQWWPVLAFLHYFQYNFGYHIFFDQTPDRHIWKCLPGWKLLQEIFV